MHRRYAIILLVAFVGQFVNAAHFASTLHVRNAAGTFEHAGACACGHHHHESDGPRVDRAASSASPGHRHCTTPTLSIVSASAFAPLIAVHPALTRPAPRPAVVARTSGVPTYRTAPKQSPPPARG